MSEDLPTPAKKSPPEWVSSTLTTAWIDTRMEADRTMVALSAGGIGLLVTLLTAVTVPRSWILWLYGLAFLGFLLAIGSGLAVFKRNANHLEEALADLDAAHSSKTREKLRALDWLLMLSFAGGVLFSISVGVATAFNSPGPEVPPPATLEFSDEGQADSTSPRNEASTRASRDPQLGGRDERADSVAGEQRSAADAPDTTGRR